MFKKRSQLFELINDQLANYLFIYLFIYLFGLLLQIPFVATMCYCHFYFSTKNDVVFLALL